MKTWWKYNLLIYSIASEKKNNAILNTHIYMYISINSPKYEYIPKYIQYSMGIILINHIFTF